MHNEFDPKFENVSKLFQNLDLIGNARIDSVMYDPAPAQTGRRGRPAKHGKRLSVETDFTFSNEKIGDYYTGVRRVLAKIFGNREILAYVTATEKEHGTKRLFFSTIFPEDLQIFCAWQEKAPLNQTGSDRMKYIPLLLYSLRWNIETSYYEQKTFWSFCNYMVRSCKGIEMLVNLINISYCAMKILPYQNEHFSEYRTKSVQEFRFELSQGIRFVIINNYLAFYTIDEEKQTVIIVRFLYQKSNWTSILRQIFPLI